MVDEQRPEFHEHLQEIRQGIAALSAHVAELCSRATDILLEGDLEGAADSYRTVLVYMPDHPEAREGLRRVETTRPAAAPLPEPPATSDGGVQAAGYLEAGGQLLACDVAIERVRDRKTKKPWHPFDRC